MRQKADEELTELNICPNGMFTLVEGLKIDINEVKEGICMRGSDEKTCFIEKERGKVCKKYIQ